MRIAYVCADGGVPVAGTKGCSIHVQEVIGAMRRRGHEVVCFAARVGTGSPTALQGVRIEQLPRFDPDAVDPEPARRLVNDAIDEALRCCGPFDLVYERHGLWSHAAMEHARRADTPGMLEVNAPLIEEQQRYRKLNNLAGAIDSADKVFAAATAVLAVSAGVAAYLEQTSAKGKVHVVPNGVDPTRFAGDGSVGEHRFTVGFVGSLKQWHGVETLVEAFERVKRDVPEARLVIVGDGPCRQVLEEQVDQLGLTGRVQFTGSLPPCKVPAVLAMVDVAVAPYPTLDKFYFSPLKIFEYMAAGNAVVASRIGQIEDLIEHEVTGMLVPPSDPERLGQTILQLAHDASLRQRLGRAARRFVTSRHTWDGVVDRVLTLACATQAGKPIERAG